MAAACVVVSDSGTEDTVAVLRSGVALLIPGMAATPPGVSVAVLCATYALGKAIERR
jgi:hypothetical protein